MKQLGTVNSTDYRHHRRYPSSVCADSGSGIADTAFFVTIIRLLATFYPRCSQPSCRS